MLFTSEFLFSPSQKQDLCRGGAYRYLLMKKFSKVLAPKPWAPRPSPSEATGWAEGPGQLLWPPGLCEAPTLSGGQEVLSLDQV